MRDRPLNAPLVLTAATLACLLPFAGKAFHIDDPLFIWTARQIHHHPLDFYGFAVNWDGDVKPMSVVMDNPPLTAYYLAAAGAVLGWSEPAMHLAMLLPALAAILGAWRMARHFCSRPLAAALATLAAPAFLISSSGVMCDTMMTAFWVWAVYFWLEAWRRPAAGRFAAAAGLMTVCALTKYFGICLVPLLGAYSLLKTQRPGGWWAWLLAPAAVMAAYFCLTQRLYGRDLLSGAAHYAIFGRPHYGAATQLLTGLAFTGGCLFAPLAFWPALWGRKGVAAGIVCAVVFAVALAGMGKVGVFEVSGASGVNWLFAAQMAVFALGGAILLVLAAEDAARARDPESILLLLWIAGVFVFAIAVNWTIAGRNILPMAPAAACLVTRRIERRGPAGRRAVIGRWLCPLGVSLAFALAAAQADYRLADSARRAPMEIVVNTELGTGSPMAFEGHWGFQYYMEQFGATALERGSPHLIPGEFVAIPMSQNFLFDLPAQSVDPYVNYRIVGSACMSVMNAEAGAGYYSDAWGPTPFVLGRAPREVYQILRVKEKPPYK